MGSRLNKIYLLMFLVGWLSPPTHLPFIFKFQLGVATVAMVAMPQEYTEDDSRQMKLPDSW